MGDNTCCLGACSKCWNIAMFITGLLILLNVFWLYWSWWTFIGALFAVYGFLGMIWPRCPHCSIDSGKKK